MKTPLQAEAAEPFAAFDGTEDSVVDFLRRRLPMTLAINTVIALLIALLLHSWDKVIPNLVIAYSIGLSILALVALVRCTIMQRFRGSLHARFAIYFMLIVVGAIGGELLSKLFLPVSRPLTPCTRATSGWSASFSRWWQAASRSSSTSAGCGSRKASATWSAPNAPQSKRSFELTSAD